MAELPLWLQPHAVIVTPYLGSTGVGPIYGPVRTIYGMLQGKKLITTASVDLLAVGTLVSASGSDYTVTEVLPRTDGNLGAWQHLEVTL